MEISIFELVIIVILVLIVVRVIARIQDWWYRTHSYVNNEKLPYEENVERWETLHKKK